MQLASVCRQNPAGNAMPYLKEWANRELFQIVSLDDEQFFTRFFTMMANCADLIDGQRWEGFLGLVESRKNGLATMLQSAVLAPGISRAGGIPTGLTPRNLFEMSQQEIRRLSLMCADAGDAGWKAKLATAAIAGQWQTTVNDYQNQIDNAVAFTPLLYAAFRTRCELINMLFTQLPPLCQIDVLQFLGFREPDAPFLKEAFYNLCTAHFALSMECIGAKTSHFNLRSLPEPYLAFLNAAYKKDILFFKTNDFAHVAKNIISASIVGGSILANWRQQPPELAMCLFLTLHHESRAGRPDQDIARRLVESQFISRQEVADLMQRISGRSGSAFKNIERWASINASRKKESFCAVS